MTSPWDDAVDRLRDLKRLKRLRPTITVMLRLVAALRNDPRLDGVAPDISHVALVLRLSGKQRYVIVEWHEDGQPGFAVSFVDPPFEFTDTRIVPQSEGPATVVDYLDQLRRA